MLLTQRGAHTGRVTYARNLYDAPLDRSFEYDGVGRLTAAHTGVEARITVGLVPPGGYPAEQYGPYSHEYEYDVHGNLTERAGWGGWHASYSLSHVNNQIVGRGYDAAGNFRDDGWGQLYSHDATGQQTAATHPAYAVESGYDGERLRVQKTENGATTYYVRSSVLGGAVVAEISGSGQWVRGYVYDGDGQLLALQAGGAVWYVHQDPVVKSQRVTSSAGEWTSSIEVEPWGTEVGTDNTAGSADYQPRRYTTYERDVDGTDEAMMRRYRPGWTRFDQPDPYDGSMDLTNPQSFNRYAYVQNDPVNFVDPSGLNMSSGGCSAEYSYSQCGGDGGFWGGGGGGGGGGWGGFGDHVANYNREYGGVPPGAVDGYRTYLERLANAQGGNGFRTSAEINGSVDAFVTVYGDGSMEGWLRGLNALASNPYIIRNGEAVPFATGHPEQPGLTPEGERAFADAIMAAHPPIVIVPSIGSTVRSLVAGTATRLGITLTAGRGAGVMMGSGGRSAALRMFNDLRGTNPVRQLGVGRYGAQSAHGHGTVTFRFPAASRSNMWSVDTPRYPGGIEKVHF